MFRNASVRAEARAKQFAEMDKDKKGYITLNEWIRFAIDHIAGKVCWKTIILNLEAREH